MQTLRALDEQLAQSRAAPRFVVWAHNSHLGDARATEMGQSGEWNVGQLVREQYPREALLVGFSTHHGHVTAASDWGGHAQRKRVRPGLPGSYEEMFHEAGETSFVLALRNDAALRDALAAPGLQRAIGVIYLAESERVSHYFHTVLPRQFDVMIHIDETHALAPLDAGAHWAREETPETFPSGV